MRKIFQTILYKQSGAILKKYQPRVIGITGSVGKTSTKEAIFTLLSSHFRTRTNYKNYNNEMGLPLTIIGAKSPGRNPLKWLMLFWHAQTIIWQHHEYPELLVLEMGIDHPGDMDYLVDLVKPEIGVLTNIGLSHLQFFGSEMGILNEKSKILKYTGQNGFAVINFDDPLLKNIIPKIKSQLLTFGSESGAQIHLQSYQIVYDKDSHNYGTEAQISYRNAKEKIVIKNAVGFSHAQACAAAIAVGQIFGITLSQAAVDLHNYKAQAGRLTVLRGINSSVIIDDTYNSSPQSVRVALRELANFPSGTKVVILGDMLELGNLSSQLHRDLAIDILHSGAEYFIAVGKLMALAASDLQKLGFDSKRIFIFPTSQSAIAKAQELVRNGVVLVKGSQGMRMEKIVKQIMFEQKYAQRLLVRQDRSWLKKP